MKKILNYEWDAIAGILAAVIGIILHLLHIVNEEVILPIILTLIALLFINFMRHTRSNDMTHEEIEKTGHIVSYYSIGHQTARYCVSGDLGNYVLSMRNLDLI